MTVNTADDRQSLYVPTPQAVTLVSPSHKSLKTPDAKLNGQIATATEPHSEHLLSAVVEEAGTTAVESPSTATATSIQKSSVNANPPTELRPSDEKIIADILKPEERLRLSKSSDKMPKSTSIHTAMSLD